MDYTLFFASIAIMLSTLRYGIYLWTIYTGQTKPHAFSWLIFGFVATIGTLAQFSLDGGFSVWALAFFSVVCLLIALLAFFVGEKNYARSDWIALLACFIAIVVWQFMENPILTLFIVMSINATAYWPTIRKSFYKPDTEPPFSYFFSGFRYCFIVLAVPELNWTVLVFPLFLLLNDWGFSIYIVVRRWQLGLPLHEYAKK